MAPSSRSAGSGVVTSLTLERPADVPDAAGRLRGPAARRGRGPLRRDQRRARTASACSPTGAGPAFDQVWLKRRVPDGDASNRQPTSSGRPRRPSRSTRSAGCRPTPAPSSSGVAGPWHERLPHFRMDHTPSQRRRAPERVPDPARARRRRAPRPRRRSATSSRRSLQISEVRTIAADDLWMSTAFGRADRRDPLHVAARRGWRPRGSSRSSRTPWRRSTRGRTGASSSRCRPTRVRSSYEKLPRFAALLAAV